MRSRECRPRSACAAGRRLELRADDSERTTSGRRWSTEILIIRKLSFVCMSTIIGFPFQRLFKSLYKINNVPTGGAGGVFGCLDTFVEPYFKEFHTFVKVKRYLKKKKNTIHYLTITKIICCIPFERLLFVPVQWYLLPHARGRKIDKYSKHIINSIQWDILLKSNLSRVYNTRYNHIFSTDNAVELNRL